MSVISEDVSGGHRWPSPLDLPAFLLFASKEFCADFDLRVTIESAEEQLQLSRTKRESATKQPQHSKETASAASDPNQAAVLRAESKVTKLILKQDKRHQYTEIYMNQCKEVPRILLKLLGMVVRFHPELYRVTFQRCPMPSACLYEIAKFLFECESKITEIILDDSPVTSRTYFLLLNRPSTLRVLSLARCRLEDEDVAALAPLLEHPLPASGSLVVLNLASNAVADLGACALGDALRTNRCLQYLNLSGNQVTSKGAIHLFDSLKEFRLTSFERADKFMRTWDYHKRKAAVFNECFNSLLIQADAEAAGVVNNISKARGAKAVPVSFKTGGTLLQRAQVMTSELVGDFNDPFLNDQVTTRDGNLYSFGNTTLSCLNLAYNRLNYFCLPVLLDVVQYQSWQLSKKGTGLMRVLIDGNNLPRDSDMYRTIDELLERAIAARAAAKKSKNQKKASKTSLMKVSA